MIYKYKNFEEFISTYGSLTDYEYEFAEQAWLAGWYVGHEQGHDEGRDTIYQSLYHLE